jgi:excisionase family DNA binding protein
MAATAETCLTESPGPPGGPRLLSRAEIAERLNVSIRSVDGLIARRELRTLRVGDRRLARREDVEAFIAAQLENAGSVNAATPADKARVGRRTGAQREEQTPDGRLQL